MIPKVTVKSPEECTNITEVRNEIDNIDKVIINLVSERFGYVRQVVKYKEKSAKAIEATDRRTAMMRDRRAWAEEKGLDPDVMEDIFNRLVEYFIGEEMKMVAP